MEKIEKYYRALREAKTPEELRKAYRMFADAFCEDEITIEQFHQLRNCFHNMRILKF